MKVWELIEVLKRLDPSAEIELSPIGDHLKDTANFEIAEPFLTRNQRLVFDPADIGLDEKVQYELEGLEQSYDELKSRYDELKSRYDKLRTAIEDFFRTNGEGVTLRKLDALNGALREDNICEDRV